WRSPLPHQHLSEESLRLITPTYCFAFPHSLDPEESRDDLQSGHGDALVESFSASVGAETWNLNNGRDRQPGSPGPIASIGASHASAGRRSRLCGPHPQRLLRLTEAYC
ncbi:MAG TPA: hypothetical protein VFH31_06890, partial [Pyrinomonadaceae bacterium]|nr:hypothetical protein [Pyrinomonadaceae bacterium]